MGGVVGPARGIGAAALPVVPIHPARRGIVLFIANSAYAPPFTLAGPKHDFALLRQTYERIGFEVVVAENLSSRNDLLDALRSFGRRVAQSRRPDDSGKSFTGPVFVHVAGHGLGKVIDGRNCNFILGTTWTEVAEADEVGVDVDEIIAELTVADGLQLGLVLDTCRDLPPTRRASPPVEPPRFLDIEFTDIEQVGSTTKALSWLGILHATGFAKTAFDGAPGKPSPLALAFDYVLSAKAPLTASAVFERVAALVAERTAGQQTPLQKCQGNSTPLLGVARVETKGTAARRVGAWVSASIVAGAMATVAFLPNAQHQLRQWLGIGASQTAVQMPPAPKLPEASPPAVQTLPQIAAAPAVPPPAIAPPTPPPIAPLFDWSKPTKCDVLAKMPNDPSNSAIGEGIDIRRIDFSQAIPACEADEVDAKLKDAPPAVVDRQTMQLLRARVSRLLSLRAVGGDAGNQRYKGREGLVLSLERLRLPNETSSDYALARDEAVATWRRETAETDRQLKQAGLEFTKLAARSQPAALQLAELLVIHRLDLDSPGPIDHADKVRESEFEKARKAEAHLTRFPETAIAERGKALLCAIAYDRAGGSYGRAEALRHAVEPCKHT